MTNLGPASCQRMRALEVEIGLIKAAEIRTELKALWDNLDAEQRSKYEDLNSKVLFSRDRSALCAVAGLLLKMA